MIWPLEPVPGIAKFIICAAKTNAPKTPISGMESRSWRYIFLIDMANRVAAIASAPKAMGADTKASDICMVYSVLEVN